MLDHFLKKIMLDQKVINQRKTLAST